MSGWWYWKVGASHTQHTFSIAGSREFTRLESRMSKMASKKPASYASPSQIMEVRMVPNFLIYLLLFNHFFFCRGVGYSWWCSQVNPDSPRGTFGGTGNGGCLRITLTMECQGPAVKHGKGRMNGVPRLGLRTHTSCMYSATLRHIDRHSLQLLTSLSIDQLYCPER